MLAHTTHFTLEVSRALARELHLIEHAQTCSFIPCPSLSIQSFSSRNHVKPNTLAWLLELFAVSGEAKLLLVSVCPLVRWIHFHTKPMPCCLHRRTGTIAAVPHPSCMLQKRSVLSSHHLIVCMFCFCSALRHVHCHLGLFAEVGVLCIVQ